MSKITLGDKTFITYIPQAELEKSIDDLAVRIREDYKDCKRPPIFLCVLNGAMMFTSEMLKRLNFDAELISIKMTSYEGTSSTGNVKTPMGLTGSVEGRDVLVFEDIVDTGNTIVALKRLLYEKGAADVKICTMLLKPEVYSQEDRIDYVAMEIENKFIVGYGLDYNELGRNYPDIYILDK